MRTLLRPAGQARRILTGLGTALAATAVFTGCGGVNVGNTDFARIRAVDAATDAAAANVLVNNSSAYGDMMNPPTKEIGNISPYLYVGLGESQFAYTSTALAAGSLVQITKVTLTSKNFYSAFLVGRPDVASTDARYLRVLVTNDSRTTPSDQASLRVIHAAPDAGAIDVLVNGSAPASSFSNISYQTSQTDFINAPYVTVPAGSLTVQVNKKGTQTPVSAGTGPTTITTEAGQAYTLIVTEPTGGTTPTYSLQLIPDQS